MGYGKDDELAINTIRTLAVHTPPSTHFLRKDLVSAIGLPWAHLAFGCRILLTLRCVDRSMRPAGPTPGTLEPPWAWLQ